MKREELYLKIEELETVASSKKADFTLGVVAGGGLALSIWTLFTGTARLAIQLT